MAKCFVRKKQKLSWKKLKKNGYINTLWPKKVTGSLEVTVTYFMTSKVGMTICCRVDLVYDLKAHGSLKVAMTYLMTPKVKMTFVVGLT